MRAIRQVSIIVPVLGPICGVGLRSRLSRIIGAEDRGEVGQEVYGSRLASVMSICQSIEEQLKVLPVERD